MPKPIEAYIVVQKSNFIYLSTSFIYSPNSSKPSATVLIHSFQYHFTVWLYCNFSANFFFWWEVSLFPVVQYLHISETHILRHNFDGLVLSSCGERGSGWKSQDFVRLDTDSDASGLWCYEARAHHRPPGSLVTWGHSSPRVQGMLCQAEQILTESSFTRAWRQEGHEPTCSWARSWGAPGAPRNLWGRLCPSFEFPQSPHDPLYHQVVAACGHLIGQGRLPHSFSW